METPESNHLFPESEFLDAAKNQSLNSHIRLAIDFVHKIFRCYILVNLFWVDIQ
jgi:hypothetical protein